MNEFCPIDPHTGLYIRHQDIYIAGKPRIRMQQINQMYKDCEDMGHVITYKWTDENIEVSKPYRDNIKVNLEVAKSMLGGAAMADVFIFFQDEDLHGALEERGAFTAKTLESPEGRKLYVIEDEKGIERESIFDSFSFIEILPDTEKIYRDLERIADLTKDSR